MCFVVWERVRLRSVSRLSTLVRKVGALYRCVLHSMVSKEGVRWAVISTILSRLKMDREICRAFGPTSGMRRKRALQKCWGHHLPASGTALCGHWPERFDTVMPRLNRWLPKLKNKLISSCDFSGKHVSLKNVTIIVSKASPDTIKIGYR